MRAGGGLEGAALDQSAFLFDAVWARVEQMFGDVERRSVEA